MKNVRTIILAAFLWMLPSLALAQPWAPVPDGNAVGETPIQSVTKEFNKRLQGTSEHGIEPKFNSYPFASLPAEVDGKTIICPDCAATSPCTSGGSNKSQLAVGGGGVWNCASFTGGGISSSLTASSLQFLDNFTRGNTALNTLGTSDSGQTYTVSGPNVANLQVLNHAATAVIGTTQFYFAPNGLTGNITQIGARVKYVTGTGSGTGTVEVLGSSGVGGLLNQMAHSVLNGTANAAATLTWWNGATQSQTPADCKFSILSSWEAVAVGDTITISYTYATGGHVSYRVTYADGTTASEDCTDPNFVTVWGNGLLPTFEAGGQDSAAIVPTFVQVWASNAVNVSGGAAAAGGTTGLNGSFPGGINGPIGASSMHSANFTGVNIGSNAPAVGGKQLAIVGNVNSSAILSNVTIDNSASSAPGSITFRNTTGGAQLGCVNFTNDTTTATPPLQICSDNPRDFLINRAGTTEFEIDNNNNVLVPSRHLILSQTTYTNVSGCGTSPVAAGSDNFGSITLGATPGTCAITYRNAFTAIPAVPPICIRNSGGTMTGLPCTTTASVLSLNPSGTPALTAGDVLQWVVLPHAP